MGLPAALDLAPLAGCVGLIAGVTAGLCGVSPGGALVLGSTLLLGADQHLAQGISLAAQVPPTSLSAIRRYRAGGHDIPMRWLCWLAGAVPIGAAVGAILAGGVSSRVLQWSYAGYLASLTALLILRKPEQQPCVRGDGQVHVRGASLLAIGLLAGISSGFLGIGGGLAIVAGLKGLANVPQHQAQLVSLLVSLIPATLPAAYLYWRMGMLAPLPLLIAAIIGLWGGTYIGAVTATHTPAAVLRTVLIIMVAAMAIYMACRALHH